MGNYGDPFTDLSVPPVGTAGTAYASSINAILTETMVRLSSKVQLTSVEPANVDLDMNSNYAVINALYFGLVQTSTVPSGAPFGRLQRYGGNLYWVDAFGVVQLTDGGDVNTAGFGGIGGDYGSGNPARLNFQEASDTYLFWGDPATSDWAGIKCDFVDVVGAGTARTRIDTRASSDNFFSLPTAMPVSRALLSVDSSGLVEHNQPVTTTLTINNADLSLTGTASFLHPNRTVPMRAATSFMGGVGTTNYLVAGTGAISGTAAWTTQHSTDRLWQGDRPKSVTTYFNKGDGASLTCTLYIVPALNSTLPVAVGTNSSTATGSGSFTTSVTTPVALAAGESLVWQLAQTGSATNTLFGFTVVYDHP